jgi:hypothetical protein|nr:MAG TPA: hypothetical protein [Caudoviricetes sp.]
MIYLYLLSLILLTIYIMYAVSVCGVPWSLSDTYYQLKKRNRPAWLFQMAMIIPAMLLMPVWIDRSTDDLQFLAFLSCGGLMFVGSAPLFKEEFQGRVHYTGTVIAGLATILWVCLSGMWYLPAVAFPVAGIIMLRYRKWLFLAEMAAFVCAYAGILISI